MNSQQGAALTKRNTTGPPWSVTYDDKEQNNTGPLHYV